MHVPLGVWAPMQNLFFDNNHNLVDGSRSKGLDFRYNIQGMFRISYDVILIYLFTERCPILSEDLQTLLSIRQIRIRRLLHQWTQRQSPQGQGRAPVERDNPGMVVWGIQC